METKLITIIRLRTRHDVLFYIHRNGLDFDYNLNMNTKLAELYTLI